MMNILKPLKLSIILMLTTVGTANASLLLQSADYTVVAEVGNPIISSTYPLTGTATVTAGSEVNTSASLTFLSSGFEQIFSGNISIDLSVDKITVAWSGTAQGVSLLFNFTNLIFDAPGTITGVSLTSETCNFAGLACSQVGAGLAIPTYNVNSIIGMGASTLAGFQPGVSFSQTYSFTTLASEPPVQPPVISAPAPTSALMMIFAAICLRAFVRKTQPE
jgi:hypothetical protein